ncbi:MAG: histidine kinase [Micrococcus sp.]|nr:histidine kinase [Micrococcus sp.]
MNPLRRVDSFSSQHPLLVDVVVAGALWLVLAVGTLVVFAGGPNFTASVLPWATSPAWVFFLSSGMILPWALRRTHPLLSASLITLFSVLTLFTGPDFLLAMITVPMTVHNLAVRASRVASLAGLGLGLIGAVANGIKVFLAPMFLASPGGVDSYVIGNAISMTLLSGLLVLTGWAFGDLARTRRLTIEDLEERAARLEREAMQERALAAADERNHIAREMHDIVAHSLQVIISQADGGRYAAAARPDLAAATLETVAETGRTALADMRQLLGILRTPELEDDNGAAELPYRPQPGLSDMDELVAALRLSGLPVELSWEGTPRRELPAGGELAAYRVVQEALTNTLRHGGPRALAAVWLSWTPEGLHIRVHDDGHGAAADISTRGSGQGLRGMHERVHLFGGTVEAGPASTGGFRVEARLPYRAI